MRMAFLTSSMVLTASGAGSIVVRDTSMAGSSSAAANGLAAMVRDDTRGPLGSSLLNCARDARVANLVAIKAGVDARIGLVRLDIRGVEAEAYLTVRLDNVARILNSTLTLLDNNPEIVERLMTTVDRRSCPRR